MILQREILRKAEEAGVPPDTIDKNWVLGHFLSELYKTEWANDFLIFKGGTCLKKCYFQDYRLSEDLDFTLINPNFEVTNKLLQSVCDDITYKIGILFSKVKIEPIRLKIKQIKHLLFEFQNNPILYVELSRYYSILGQENKSLKAMRTALHLAPNNRFVIRSGSRLFAHYHSENNDYLEYIHKILRTSSITAFDPWLTSTEISIAHLCNKSSKFVKKGIELVNSRNISPFNFTELASSIGTVELMHGNTKKSRDYFKKALISPNDNTLAQLEWASTKDTRLDINPSDFNVKMNFEALALDCYHNKNYELAIENALKWYIDMPFSKRPIMLGSNISTMILKDQSKAISFLNAGLLSNPNDPQLINNLAYSLALDGQPKEALNQINKIRITNDIDEITQICLNATIGLAYYRDGFSEMGRQYYLDAIEKTNQIHNKELNWIAILNYAREEILIRSENVKMIMEAVSKIPKEYNDIEIQIMRRDVLDLYETTYKI